LASDAGGALDQDESRSAVGEISEMEN